MVPGLEWLVPGLESLVPGLKPPVPGLESLVPDVGWISGPESNDDFVIPIAFRPRAEYSKSFRFLKLYK